MLKIQLEFYSVGGGPMLPAQPNKRYYRASLVDEDGRVVKQKVVPENKLTAWVTKEL